MSDFDSVNKGISIRTCCEAEHAEVIKVDKQLFQAVLNRTKRLDDGTLAVKDMAVNLGTFANTMSAEIGATSRTDPIRYTKLIKNCNKVVHGNLICFSDTPYLEANARSYYDWAIKNSTIKIKKRSNAKNFLDSCGFVCYAELCQDSIRPGAKTKDVKIGVLNKAELGAMSCLESLYDKGSALLLLQKLNKTVQVINC